MNRIILIGNGFDLAHGLETSYIQFINDYWENTKKNIKLEKKTRFDNQYQMYEAYCIENDEILFESPNVNSIEISDIKNKAIYINDFFKIITNSSSKNWVDIEEEYFKALTKCLSGSIDKLNQDFDNIRVKLQKYLNDELDRKNIKQLIYSDFFQTFKVQDFSSEGKGIIRDKYFSYTNEETIKFNRELKSLASGFIKSYDTEIYPELFLFLNFNYTDLPTKIINNVQNIKWQLDDWARKPMETISLHGRLNDSENPIIFGYGDEDDEYHKAIEKRGGGFLNNIKTINYLKTENYKKLLSYIESDYYQVFIFGHSCGLSDKTLLKTLFEHKHCVSIKPFYFEYEKETKQNNYNDIVKNIYRVFSNKTTMRDKVVPETYCQALEQITK